MNYIVRRGDTLWSIAQRFGVTLEAIMAANQITDPNSIYVGQTIFIPIPNQPPYPPAPYPPNRPYPPVPPTNLEERVERLEQQVQQLDRTVDRLVRRVRRLEQGTRPVE